MTMTESANTPRIAQVIVLAVILTWIGGSFLCITPAFGELATHSFTNHAGGSHPSTLSFSADMITVDLSAIIGSTVYRATLDPGRSFDYVDVSFNVLSNTTMQISNDGNPLPLLAPRFDRFELTAAVQSAVAGNGSLTLSIDEAGSGFGGRISLDVLCNVAAPSAIPTVTGATARFENGDAMITFEEPNVLIDGTDISCADFWMISQGMDDVTKTRFRIYRAGIPLTSEQAITEAVMVDEIKPLSGWNPRFAGPGGHCYPPYGGGTVYTLPIDDNIHAQGNTGIYVERYEGTDSETSYYFVSHTVDGAEDFSTLQEGLNATGPVSRLPGTGMVILNKEEHLPEFNYGESEGQYYYVKWEDPPTSNFPSSPFNYVVVVPSAEWAVDDPGINLALHCWGGNLNSCYGWWYYWEQGHLLVAGNQFPFQDWWTGYHENLGTLKAHDEGTVKPFTMHRLLAFIYDFVVPEYNANTERITLAGSSMGGAGTSLVGLRNGQIFSNLISWVGIHIPAESPQFASSFEAAWGSIDYQTHFSNLEFAERFGGQNISPEDDYIVWDYYDNDQWLRANPEIETPWLTYSNGVDDNGIGWPQAVAHTEALIDTYRPFNFQWGMNGHNQRVALLDPYGYDKTQKSHLLFTRTQSHPIFRNASTDHDFLTESSGKINPFCSWNTEDIVDDPERWEISIFIPDAPSGGSYGEEFPESLEVDVLPTHLQNFAPTPDSLYQWTWSEAADSTVISSGSVIADPLGRVVIPQLTMLKNQPRRLQIVGASTPASANSGPNQAGEVMMGLCRPNPFTHSTEIHFNIPRSTTVRITIHDISGRRVRTLIEGEQPAGLGVVAWDGLDDRDEAAPSGTYFLRLVAEECREVQRLLLLR